VPRKLDPELDAREHLAAERTLLAYVRTSLAMMGFGFVVARFRLLLRVLEAQDPAAVGAQPAFAAWFGTAMVVVGILASAGGGWSYLREIERLNRRAGADCYPASRLAIFLAVALTAIGAAMAIYLVLTSEV